MCDSDDDELENGLELPSLAKGNTPRRQNTNPTRTNSSIPSLPPAQGAEYPSKASAVPETRSLQPRPPKTSRDSRNRLFLQLTTNEVDNPEGSIEPTRQSSLGCTPFYCYFSGIPGNENPHKISAGSIRKIGIDINGETYPNTFKLKETLRAIKKQLKLLLSPESTGYNIENMAEINKLKLQLFIQPERVKEKSHIEAVTRIIDKILKKINHKCGETTDTNEEILKKNICYAIAIIEEAIRVVLQPDIYTLKDSVITDINAQRPLNTLIDPNNNIDYFEIFGSCALYTQNITVKEKETTGGVIKTGQDYYESIISAKKDALKNKALLIIGNILEYLPKDNKDLREYLSEAKKYIRENDNSLLVFHKYQAIFMKINDLEEYDKKKASITKIKRLIDSWRNLNCLPPPNAKLITPNDAFVQLINVEPNTQDVEPNTQMEYFLSQLQFFPNGMENIVKNMMRKYNTIFLSDKYFYVVAHATSSHIWLEGGELNTSNEKCISLSSMKSMEYLKTNINKYNKNSLPIVFFSCSLASGEGSLAEALSKIIAPLTIYAPTSTFTVGGQGIVVKEGHFRIFNYARKMIPPVAPSRPVSPAESNVSPKRPQNTGANP